MTTSSGLLPLPDDLPTAMREALHALAKLSDSELQRVVRERMAAAAVEEFDELRERRRAGQITGAEARRLNELTEHADLLMLRKAQAAALLKQRGQPVPTPAELGA
ncbi:MAG TPA: hypothetical protein PKD53_09250 [Chloroflexaceae bacterium]|nr:hypothetical protein [Chloroflexaceae bacterium]